MGTAYFDVSGLRTYLLLGTLTLLFYGSRKRRLVKACLLQARNVDHLALPLFDSAIGPTPFD